MAEEKKKDLKAAEAGEIKVPEKKPVFKQEKPWEHFKNKGGSAKNFRSHGKATMNRRTGGG